MSESLDSNSKTGQVAPTRTLSAAELSVFLRVAVGLPPLEDGTAVDRTPVTIDAEAWAEWCLAGLRVCAPPSETTAPQDRRGPWVPRIRDATEAGRCFAANLAMERCGSITHAAAGLKTSRRALREALKRAGSYQPPAYMTHDDDHYAASADRAVDVLAKLARGMSEASISTAGGPVRVRMVDGLVRIELEGEAPIDASQRKALPALTTVLERLGGPMVGVHDGEAYDGENGGTDAI